MKYIDADRLKAEIEKPKNELKVGNYYLDNSEQAVGYENALIDFELLIASLQQEQSETDLDADIETKKESESDENERIRQALDKIFKRYLNLVVSLEEECRHSWRELVDAMQLGINAMKEGQKSAESNYFNVNSEYDKGYKEDEKIIESICRSINEESIAEGLKCHGKSYSINELSELRIKMINFLKSINQKLKQEWSEEDENALKYIHELLVFGYTEKFMDAQTAHDMRKWVNEHLRPDTFQNGNSHWKPSEEQMEALKNSAYGAYQNGDGPALRELYEQLEKL